MLLATGNYVVTSVILVYIFIVWPYFKAFLLMLSRVSSDSAYSSIWRQRKRVNGIVSGIETVKILNAKKNIIIEKYNVDNNKLINAWRDFFIRKKFELELG
ncbi:hypothetical protein ACFS3C_04395 [Azotobacter vinelandii]